MTKKEALQILAILKAAYPSSYNGMTKEEASGTVAVWGIQFSDVPVYIVMMAVQKCIAESKFPPSISEVKSKIGNLHWEAYDAIREVDAGKVIPEEQVNQYKRIYEETKDYKFSKAIEPKLSQMLQDGQRFMIGDGGALDDR